MPGKYKCLQTSKKPKIRARKKNQDPLKQASLLSLRHYKDTNVKGADPIEEATCVDPVESCVKAIRHGEMCSRSLKDSRSERQKKALGRNDASTKNHAASLCASDHLSSGQQTAHL